ncbi:hypothetical protein [Rhizobium sullae]|uniref:Uncharacterized protein n=1 Tax=Rhizobium sullae TaxID=50338 RepID=A0A2N0DD49_RHISU|nr:hypothetical protein [Rhizobium sullae]PKA44027.1 hypothetical protein CWR43_06885 [Rhizobium sullae]
MRSLPILLAALSVASSLIAEPAFATDWNRAGKADVQPLYPYPDLPGVKSQPDKKDEEKYACRTETRGIRRNGDWIFRSGGMPTIVYVCDRDGYVSQGTQVPARGHYQPVR